MPGDSITQATSVPVPEYVRKGVESLEKDTRHRKYLLTINNPGDDWSHEKIRNALESIQLKYWCLADEVGLQEQTPHGHIYFVAKNAAIRFSTVKKLFPTAHIEPAQGSSEENRDYGNKSELSVKFREN